MVQESQAMALIGRRNGKQNKPGEIVRYFAVRWGEAREGKHVHSTAAQECGFDVPQSRKADIVFCVCEVNNGEQKAPQHRMAERPILLKLGPHCDDLPFAPAWLGLRC
jgi:hypothetical protein